MATHRTVTKSQTNFNNVHKPDLHQSMMKPCRRFILIAMSSVSSWSSAITLRSLSLILVFIFAILSLNSSLNSVPKTQIFSNSDKINLSASKPSFDSRIISSQHLLHVAHATVARAYNGDSEEEAEAENEAPPLQFHQSDAQLIESDANSTLFNHSPADDQNVISQDSPKSDTNVILNQNQLDESDANISMFSSPVDDQNVISDEFPKSDTNLILDQNQLDESDTTTTLFSSPVDDQNVNSDSTIDQSPKSDTNVILNQNEFDTKFALFSSPVDDQNAISDQSPKSDTNVILNHSSKDDQINELDESDTKTSLISSLINDDQGLISDGIHEAAPESDIANFIPEDHDSSEDDQNAGNEDDEINVKLNSSSNLPQRINDEPELKHKKIKGAAPSTSNINADQVSSKFEENSEKIIPQTDDQNAKTSSNSYIGSSSKTPTSRKSHPRNRRRRHNQSTAHSPASASSSDTHSTNKYSKSDVSSQARSPSNSLNGISNPTCDPYIGDWVEDDTYPIYSPGTCPFVEKKFDCQKNGRPDTKYTTWRWVPKGPGCNMPRFNGTDMLERLRGKRLAFVGDSLSRNQFESLVCMLREGLSEKGKKRISKVHCDDDSFHIFNFKDYDFRVELYTSRYLVEWDEGPNEIPTTITLDAMDSRSEALWKGAHVLIFNTDHWWGPGKIGKGENLFKEKNKLYAKLDVAKAYGKTISTWARWVKKNVNPKNTIVFYRSHSPIHYKVGDWNTGGQCDDDVEPIFDKSYTTPLPPKLKYLNDVLDKNIAPIHYLNVSHLSGYRKDAHPSVYFHPQDVFNKYQDCSHWCLPGLPDTWNELLYFELTKYFQL